MEGKKTQVPRTVAAELAQTFVAGAPIAAFDFDSTLVEHKGKGPDAAMTALFISLLLKSFNVVIFSNRRTTKRKDGSPWPLGKASEKTIDEIRQYVDKVKNGRQEAMPISYLGSLEHDRFRKPHRGMWELYVAHLGALGYEMSDTLLGASFFCGDAAGRFGDFAATDLSFAIHCGLRFVVPEAIFGGMPNPLPWNNNGDLFDPTNPDAKYSTEVLDAIQEGKGHCKALARIQMAVAKKHSCIVMMGGQGSGKTTIAAQLAADGFAVVSRERIAEDVCIRELKRALRAGANVVVDGTHKTAGARASIIKAAESEGVFTVIVHVTTPKGICVHMNAARCELDKSGRTPEVPIQGIHSYWKYLEPPTADEANIIIEVPFVLAAGAPPEVTEFRYA